MHKNSRSAFTLVELSIVLVVIGLIVGGVLAGQSILRASQVRSLGTDLTSYASAVQSFRGEFHQIPGDMSNATSYWGIAAGSTGIDATCYSADESNGTATCNGNGNGTINYTNPANSNNDGTENYLAWKHLNDAGLIAGTYSGKTANTTTTVYGTVGGTNSPSGKLDGSTYSLFDGLGCVGSGDTHWFAGCYGIILEFGANAPTSFSPQNLITPAEMYGMDKKIDDGNPGTGQMRTYVNTPTCYSSSTAYALSDAGNDCSGFLGVDPIK